MSILSLNIMFFLILMINGIFSLLSLLETIPEENVHKKRFQFQQKSEHLFMTSTVLDVAVVGEE